jgi:hypothetical protein
VITAGETVIFDLVTIDDPRGPFTSADTSLTVYLIGPEGERLEATGQAQGTGWRVTWTASQTAALVDPTAAEPRSYQASVRVTRSGESYSIPTLATTITVRPDPAQQTATKTRAEAELAEVREAIRAIQQGAQSYTIGERTVTRAELGLLYRREAMLAAAVQRQRAGTLGRWLVHFTRP